MEERRELFDELSAVLTRYEEGGAEADDLYKMLVKIQNLWEDVISAEGQRDA